MEHIVLIRRRSLWERLCTRPWRPFLREVREVQLNALEIKMAFIERSLEHPTNTLN